VVKTVVQDARGGQYTGVVEVEFATRNDTYPFVSASAEDCVFELAKMVPRNGEQYSEFFNVTGTEPRQVLDAVADYDDVEASLLREYENGGLVEFLVTSGCPAVTLANLGALPQEIMGMDGEGRIAAEITPRHDPAAVISTFLDEVPDMELVSKQSKDTVTPLLTESAFEQVLDSRLTERQREVLRAAFESGYYEWPRECTGEDIADELDITSSTFSEHIHAAERKLLTTVFDGQ